MGQGDWLSVGEGREQVVYMGRWAEVALARAQWVFWPQWQVYSNVEMYVGVAAFGLGIFWSCISWSSRSQMKMPVYSYTI